MPTCRPKELAAARDFGEEQACWCLAAQHGVSAAQDSVPIHRKREDQHGVGSDSTARHVPARRTNVCTVHTFELIFWVWNRLPRAYSFVGDVVRSDAFMASDLTPSASDLTPATTC